jgi:hypothetical protein
MGIASSASTLATGFLFQRFGTTVGFITVTVVAALATVLIWLFVSETKPEKY